MIVKLGGSLLDWPGLAEAWSRFATARREAGDRLAILVGGGGPTDWIRHLDGIHVLGEKISHDLAMRSLDLTAAALVAVLGSGQVALHDRIEADSVWSAADDPPWPVLLIREAFEAAQVGSSNPLPECWDLTSDSLAAWAASNLDADRIVLLKSVTPAASESSLETWAEAGIVDRLFARITDPRQRVQFVNLRESSG